MCRLGVCRYIGKVEHIVLRMLQISYSLRLFRQEWTGRFVVRLVRFDGHDLALWITQGCEFPPKTQPVSRLIVLFSQSGSGTGVCP